MSTTNTILIPHWKNPEETKQRIENALTQSVPVTPIILNWGQGDFPGTQTTADSLAQVISTLPQGYVQFITPGAYLFPAKIADCLNSISRPIYLDAQIQGTTKVGIPTNNTDLEVLEHIATGSTPLTIDAALFGTTLLKQIAIQSPQGIARLGRRILGGADRWLLLDAIAHDPNPFCSDRVSSMVPAPVSTGLGSTPMGKWGMEALLYEHRSLIAYRQADGFNAMAQNSLWDWESITFLEKNLWGKILLINAPTWLPLTLPNCNPDTSGVVQSLPAHYEYYPNYFEAIVTDDPARDIPIWASTLKENALVVSWVEQLKWEQHGGVWSRKLK